jgi:hypothetical protein
MSRRNKRGAETDQLNGFAETCVLSPRGIPPREPLKADAEIRVLLTIAKVEYNDGGSYSWSDERENNRSLHAFLSEGLVREVAS